MTRDEAVKFLRRNRDVLREVAPHSEWGDQLDAALSVLIAPIIMRCTRTTIACPCVFDVSETPGDLCEWAAWLVKNGYGMKSCSYYNLEDERNVD